MRRVGGRGSFLLIECFCLDIFLEVNSHKSSDLKGMAVLMVLDPHWQTVSKRRASVYVTAPASYVHGLTSVRVCLHWEFPFLIGKKSHFIALICFSDYEVTVK